MKFVENISKSTQHTANYIADYIGNASIATAHNFTIYI